MSSSRRSAPRSLVDTFTDRGRIDGWAHSVAFVLGGQGVNGISRHPEIPDAAAPARWDAHAQPERWERGRRFGGDESALASAACERGMFRATSGRFDAGAARMAEKVEGPSLHHHPPATAAVSRLSASGSHSAPPPPVDITEKPSEVAAIIDSARPSQPGSRESSTQLTSGVRAAQLSRGRGGGGGERGGPRSAADAVRSRDESRVTGRAHQAAPAEASGGLSSNSWLDRQVRRRRVKASSRCGDRLVGENDRGVAAVDRHGTGRCQDRS